MKTAWALSWVSFPHPALLTGRQCPAWHVTYLEAWGRPALIWSQVALYPIALWKVSAQQPNQTTCWSEPHMSFGAPIPMLHYLWPCCPVPPPPPAKLGCPPSEVLSVFKLLQKHLLPGKRLKTWKTSLWILTLLLPVGNLRLAGLPLEPVSSSVKLS